jgi:hypothetical protein
MLGEILGVTNNKISPQTSSTTTVSLTGNTVNIGKTPFTTTTSTTPTKRDASNINYEDFNNFASSVPSGSRLGAANTRTVAALADYFTNSPTSTLDNSVVPSSQTSNNSLASQ